MSRDGNGNYTRVPGSGYPNGTTADGPEVDAEMNDIATALTQSLSKDGQTVPTANLPMGGYRHTNVDDAASRTDYARAAQVQDCALSTLSSVSGADTITATAPLSMTAYVAGQEFSFVSAGANTGAVTLNINSIGAKDVTKRGTTALDAGDIPSGAVVVVQYDGTRFQVVSTVGDSDAVKLTGAQTIADVKTFSSSPVMPGNASTALQAVPKQQLDAETTARGVAISAAVSPATLAPTLLVSLGSVGMSGTSQQLTGVPSWALRVECELVGVGTNGTDLFGIQVADAGVWATSGYSGSVSQGATAAALSTGFTVSPDTASGNTWTGRFTLERSNAADTTWICTGLFARTSGFGAIRHVVGQITVSALNNVRVALYGGASTFNAGTFRAKAGA